MMRSVAALCIPGLVAGGLWLLAGSAPGEEAAAKKVSAVVIVGGHGYDVKDFPKLFEGYDDIVAAQPSEKEGAALFDNVDGWKYDTIVLYNFSQKLTDKQKENFLALLDKGVGLYIMHHAIAAYPDWPEYREILGARYYLGPVEENGAKHPASQWKDDVDYKVHIEDPQHPITKGMADFEVKDETYNLYDVSPKVHLLLSTDEKTNARTLGWCHLYHKARVCYIQLGHGAKVYVNKDFRRLVAQAIRWTGGQLPEGDLKPMGTPAAAK